MSLNLFSKNEKPTIKILGASGGKSDNKALTSLQISSNSVIDAGNLIDGLGSSLQNLEHIFLTHLHLDHIVDIPFVLDNIYEIQTKPIKIYGQQENLDALKKHIFNWDIWPDFTTIKMKNSDEFCAEFIPIDINNTIIQDNYSITPIANKHTDFSNGFVISKNNSSLLFTSDTYCCDSIWERVNNDASITTIIIEISFPSNFEKLATDSKHLTPKLLEKELQKLQRDDVTIHINHLKPSYETEILNEIKNSDILLNGGTVLQKNDIVYF